MRKRLCCSVAIWAAASSNPATKLASWQLMLVDGSRQALAMCQYPEGALCTELWKRVGDISRGGAASTLMISSRVRLSPADDAKIVATLDRSTPSACDTSVDTANASLTLATARRRSAG